MNNLQPKKIRQEQSTIFFCFATLADKEKERYTRMQPERYQPSSSMATNIFSLPMFIILTTYMKNPL